MGPPQIQRQLTPILGVIAAIMVGWVFHVGASIIQPLVIALLLASMLQPVVSWMARRRIPPPVTVLMIISGLFFILLQLGLLFQTNVREFLGEAAAQVPIQRSLEQNPAPAVDNSKATPPPQGDEVATKGQEPAAGPADDGSTGGDQAEAEGVMHDIFQRQQEAMSESGGWAGIKVGIRARIESAEQLPDEMRNYAISVWDDFDPNALVENVALSGYGFVKSLVLVLIYMVFIFAEAAIFRRKILHIAEDNHKDAEEILDRIGRGIQRYLGVKTVVSFLTGSLCYVVLVSLDIPYALLFGIITFALNYIPTFGSIAAGILPFITALAVEESVFKAAAVVVTYMSVNLTLGSFIEPRILGRELNLSPLVVVVSVVVWAGLWGVVGGFLAVPLTAAMQIILASNDTTRPVAVMLGSGPERRKRAKPEPAP
jgi:predicted PurR-regulated permease PerM